MMASRVSYVLAIVGLLIKYLIKDSIELSLFYCSFEYSLRIVNNSGEINQATGNEAASWIPHWPGPSPFLANKMYPFCPHDPPHEFFTLIKSFPLSDP